MDALEVLCAADINKDGAVDPADVSIVWATSADINGDGVYNYQDLSLAFDSANLQCHD